jgi:hypothetical protein
MWVQEITPLQTAAGAERGEASPLTTGHAGRPDAARRASSPRCPGQHIGCRGLPLFTRGALAMKPERESRVVMDCGDPYEDDLERVEPEPQTPPPEPAGPDDYAPCDTGVGEPPSRPW